MLAVRRSIPGGDAGIEATLRVMQRLVDQAPRSAEVVSWAHDVVRSLPARDKDAEAEAFLAWVRANSRYTNDPVTAELVKSPEVMLREWREKGRIIEDCEGLSTLLAAGLNVVGIESEFVVIGDGSNGDEYSHVFVRYLSPVRGWVTMDPIVSFASGWVPPRATRFGTFNGSTGLEDANAAGVQGFHAKPRCRIGCWILLLGALALLTRRR